jgi:hypothetical protein
MFSSSSLQLGSLVILLFPGEEVSQYTYILRSSHLVPPNWLLYIRSLQNRKWKCLAHFVLSNQSANRFGGGGGRIESEVAFAHPRRSEG